MHSCSEYVSPGHPDSTCDAIASYILDAFIERDPKTRFALEVQLKDNICNLAGEVTSQWKPEGKDWYDMVRGAIRSIGYSSAYAEKWPQGATLNADKVMVNNFIGQQSPNIAQGVDRDGWGDQGVFCGMATSEAEYDHMPRDVYFSREIGQMLYAAALLGHAPIGLDIKTLVSVGEGNNVEQVIVAAPMMPDSEKEAKAFIEDTIKEILAKHSHTCGEIIINGTGAYVVHSSVGDAGVVGRKLAVNFYGLNCPIGGGSPWGKDPTKADVSLNLMARKLSMKTILESKGVYKAVYTKISCCIGKSRCLVAQFDQDNNLINTQEMELSPSSVIKELGLDGSVDMPFYTMATDGLFTLVDKSFGKNA